jgi:Tol biopolymer transport system component
MGEVYKARDTRLNRLVAIKVSNERFSARVKREAQAIAALSHPHICQLFDIGELPDGGDYLVMEHLEGETLAGRLARGPLPIDDALRIAMQIADALEAAHRKGVVHRDVKPANIMLTKSGVKLLDFGLASMSHAAAPDATTVTGMTAPGTIVGTLQYMTPEQLEGGDADARTDVFAFGAVLYEMVTGYKAFEGTSQASLISSIMSGQPPSVAAVLPSAPRSLDHIVQASLARNPDARWQSAHDVKLALASVTTTEAAQPSAPKQPLARTAVWVAAGLVLGVVTLLAAAWLRRAPEAPIQTVRSSLLPPAGWAFERYGFAVSPDGTRLAFVAVGGDGATKLWVRSLAASDPQQLSGTDGATFPFWAPDSRRIGFFAAGKLKTIELGTGTLRILCDAPHSRGGGAWSRDGTIVFAPSNSGPLLRVADSGGVPAPITTLPRPGSGQVHRWPVFLPDGKRFLYFADWSVPEDGAGNGLYTASLDGGPPKLITAERAGNVASTAGLLVSGRDRSLRVQSFDPTRLELSESATSILEQEVEQHPGFSFSDFSASQNGVLVFRSLADSVSKLTWFDAAGRELGEIPILGYAQPRLSPKGRLLAVASDDGRNGEYFVRVYDLARGGASRLTEGGNEENPVWSPDGHRITYSTYDGKLFSILELPADGSAPPQLLVKGAPMRHTDWSPQGHLVFTDFSTGGPILKIYSVATKRVAPFGGRSGAEPRFSPDGRWIAYTSPAAGGPSVLVEPFPGPGARIAISTAGGAQPVWSHNGGELYYISPDRKLMAVRFNSREGTASAPRVLFQTRIVAPNYFSTQYDVSRDGRFLINSFPSNYSSPLTLLTGWTAQVRR